MASFPSPERAAAAAALHRADDEIRAMRAGALDGAARDVAITHTADSIEHALRRWLRDAEAVALEVRLRAQDPEELGEDAVLAELRQRDLLSMRTAAAIHAAFGARARVAAGNPSTPDDESILIRAVESVWADLDASAAPESTLAQPHVVSAADDYADEGMVHAVPPPQEGVDRRWVIGSVLALLLLVIAVIAISNSNRSDPQLAEGIALFRSGAYEDAASRFWRYAEANPDDALPHLYLARIHRRTGRIDMARDEIRKALEIDPEDAGAHAELGFLLLDTGQTGPAIDRFRAAIALDETSASAWIGLIQALNAEGRVTEAEEELDRAPEEVRDLFTGPARPSPGAP